MKQLNHRQPIRAYDCSPTILWCASVVLAGIAVVSLLPFSFDVSMAGESDWFGLRLLRWGGSSLDDIVANVAAYVPLGLLLALSVRSVIRHRAPLIVSATVITFAVSLTFEWLQTMMSGRVASWTDVCNNMLGGFVGSVVGANGQYIRAARVALLRSVRIKPLTKVAAFGAIGLIVYHVAPFDVVTSTDKLRASLSQSNLWPITGWSSPSQIATAGVSAILDWVLYAVQFAVLGFIATSARFQRPTTIIFERRRPHPAAATAFLEILAVALTIEVLQLFVMSHAFELMDLASALAGGVIGVALRVVTHPIPRISVRPILAMLGGLMLLAILITAAIPFDFSWGNLQLSNLRQLPLAAQFQRPFAAALADMIRYVTQYTLMAALIRFALGDKFRYVRLIAIVPILTITACCAEFLQLLSTTRTPDLTAPFVALFVGVTITIWQPGPIDEQQITPAVTSR